MASHRRALAFHSSRRIQNSFNRTAAVQRRLRARRRAALLLYMSTILVLCTELFFQNPRSQWVFHRSSHWWEDVVVSNFTEHDWMENFRMSQEAFKYLCDKLRPMIEKQNTRMRRCVSTERRVAITLWVLATPSEYRSVAHLFGVAWCTVCQIVRKTCIAIVHKLTPVYINFPSGDGLKEVVKGFKDKWGIPQCAGSIDGSHVPVNPSSLTLLTRRAYIYAQ